ncbi:MAG: peptide chain release factor N(5)-glutamine methyltransferase [Eubacteriales bacterium]|nr:peptide chain release factor N(5)-glutamine methyltransferase [Eubacteriales bacterium]
MKVKVSKIGGQAVMEGVMMRGEKSVATAVRKPNGDIVVDSSRVTLSKRMKTVGKIPIVRGIINFCNMIFLGTKTLMNSAEMQGVELEPSKFEKWFSEKFKLDLFSVAMWIGVILGVLLAVGLFFVLPQVFTSLIMKIPGADSMHVILKNLIEGVIRIAMFVLYILLVSLMKDVKRVFMYHGAEHKTINCYESGKPLTIENVRNSSRIHNRCGTTFLFIVMIISILLFSLCGWDSRWWVRLLIRLALIPLVMGVSYEILKVLAKYDNLFVNILRGPGLLLQRVTTANPTDEMLMVAMASFKTVQKLDEDETLPTGSGVYLYDYFEIKDLVDSRSKIEGYEEEFEWILCSRKNVERVKLVSSKFDYDDVSDAVYKLDRVKNGEPLDYVLGESVFYGYKLTVNKNVLVPRPETELVVEQALKYITTDSRVLDLCTGSGAIAITIKKQSGASVVASDISEGALSVAKLNARKNDADVKFVLSDLFENVEGEFDVIVSNPPYIRSGDIEGLDRSVKDYEPRLALDGGESGFDVYDKILTALPSKLKSGGTLVFECGYDQADELIGKINGFKEVFAVKDYSGIDRIIIAKGYENV